MYKYSQIRHYIPYVGTSLALIAIAVAMVPITTLGFELPKFVALAAVATICALIFLLRGESILHIFRRSWAGNMYLAFALITLLSPLWSVAAIASTVGVAPRFQGVLTYSCVFTLGLAAASLVQSKRGRSLATTAILSSNIIVTMYGILQMLNLDPLQQLWLSEAFLGRVFSTLGHPNMLGQFIVLTVPFTVLALVKAKRRLVRLWWLALTMLNGVVLFGTVSRSALLGALVLVVLIMPTLKRVISQHREHIKAEQGFALSLVFVLIASIGLLFFAQRFTQSFEVGRSFAARQVIWGTSVQMIWQRPYGWGLDTMAFTTPAFLPKDIYAFESLTTVVDRAHNELLQITLSLGYLGLAIFLLLLVAVLSGVYEQGEEERSGILRAAGAGILAYVITLLFGFPSIATLAFFWILLGMCIGLLGGKEVYVAPRKDAVLRWLIAVTSVCSLVVSLQWMQARLVHAYARSFMSQNVEIGLAVHQEGLLTFRYDRESIIEVTQAHLLAFEQQSDNEQLRISIEALIMLLQNATGERDGMVHILRAWLYAIEGKREAVDAALYQARGYYKSSMVYHRAAAHIYSLLGDGTAVYEQQSMMRGLLPDTFFEDDSETRRILFKQHPWLKELF